MRAARSISGSGVAMLPKAILRAIVSEKSIGSCGTMPDGLAQGRERQLADIAPVEQDAAAGRLDQAGEQLDHGGFARAGAPDDRELAAGGDLDVDVRAKPSAAHRRYRWCR